MAGGEGILGQRCRYNDINVKARYGNGHLELAEEDGWLGNDYGTIFVESGR